MSCALSAQGGVLCVESDATATITNSTLSSNSALDVRVCPQPTLATLR